MFEQVTLFLFIVQVLKLQNTGALPVHYEVDTDVLLKLQMDNFNHAVLTCLNPEGHVPAGQSAMVEWIFSPLEAKLYSVRLIPTVHTSFRVFFETSPVGSETPVSVVTLCMFPICVSLDGNTYSRPWWRHDAADVWRNWICFTHRWQPRDLLLQRRWSTFTLCPQDTFSRTGESSCYDLCYVYLIHFFVATVCSLPVKYS